MGSEYYGIVQRWITRIGGLAVAIILLMGPPELLNAQQNSYEEEYFAKAAELYPNITINRDEPKSAALSKIISIKYNNATLGQALSDIARKAGYWLSYSDQNVPLYRTIDLELENVTVKNAIWTVLEGTGLRYAISPNGHLVLMKWKKEKEEEVEEVLDGIVSGYVYDSRTGDALPGANVRVAGTNKGTATDDAGQFVLRGVSSGEQVLVVSYLGYETQRVEVDVEDGEETELEIELQDNFVEMEGIMVRGTREGQVRALSRQKEAANIKNVIDAELIATFPDPNVGESLKRIPGINVQSDQGEARFVQIRGASPTLNNVSINGEQVAAPEGDERSVNLDMIPSDVLASIEVTKAITPDMDGDAIGGTINLETKSAITRDREFNVTLNGGYHNNVNDFTPMGGRASVNFGQRVGDNGEFGYMIGANYNKNSIGSDNNEMEYDEGNLDEMQLRDYELIRERFGLSSNFDYRFSRSSKLLLNASYNYFDDLEYRRRLTLASDEVLREFKDRLEKQKVFSASIGGEHAVSETFFVDYRIAYSYSDQNTPLDNEIGYAQAFEDMAGDDIDFIGFDRSDPDYPQFSLTSAAPAEAGVYNYGSYEFDELAAASEFTSEDHITTRLNLRTDYSLSDNVNGFLKFGGKLRFKSKDRGLNENIYGGYNGSSTFESLLSDFEDDDFLFGNYAQGPGLFPGDDALDDLVNNNIGDFEYEEDESDEASTAEDYDASEDTYAGYIMTDLQLGDLGTVIGLRYEHVVSEYTGHVVEYNDAEELVRPIPTASDKNEYDFILPMVHLKYQIQDNINLRLAWTNTFAKPNYFNQVPFRIISRPDEEIELGNPDLDPTRSTNLDFMAEYYFRNIGILSAGAFYKNIRDFIYTANFEFGQAPYVGYEATQPINGEDADLAGFEVALQNQLTFLPGFASGFGIYANYTYTWSEARLLTEGGTFRTVQLPGQAQNMANVAISYQKYGFSGRISLNYSGSFIEEIRETRSADRYYDSHTQIDISVSQQITDNIQVFADVINLTNEPLRFYNGVPARPEQQEYYSWWTKLGAKLTF